MSRFFHLPYERVGKMTKKYWLLVDFDNTMMETEPFSVSTLVERFNQLYGKEIEHPFTLAEFQEHFHGQARENLCENMSRHFGIKVDYPTLFEDREWRMMQYLKNVPGGIPMAPHILEAFANLEKKGFGFAFVSNNPIQRGLATMRYAAGGRGMELARVFGHNFFESGPTQKPKPDVYLHAMEQIGLKAEQCFAIEDSATGVGASVTAGIRTFAFTGFADNPKKMAGKLIGMGCVAAFHDWADLPKMLAPYIETT
ncbi:MAG TPA: hypothetical protein DCW68_05030 [Rhodospirillaceae bacterium]|nr:MAG: hypothetical protein A2018_02615 [Alphaproteobacteria bacterium GWF2_58_20]HAU29459.1 hypothetical protein [Rhodospirillaceae bacterium]